MSHLSFGRRFQIRVTDRSILKPKRLVTRSDDRYREAVHIWQTQTAPRIIRDIFDHSFWDVSHARTIRVFIASQGDFAVERAAFQQVLKELNASFGDAMDIKFESLGVPQSVVVTGADRTSIWPTVKAAAEKNHLEIEIDQRAHLGIFYSSDHFSMARSGIPAFSVAAGTKITGKPNDFATKAHKDFNDKAYQSPQDKIQPAWSFSVFVVLAEFMLDVARDAANSDRLPTWNVGNEFRRATR